MKKETLKPCPFCGQKHTTITESNAEGVRICCPRCNITFTRDFYEHRGELGRQTTIEAWNTRPDMSELVNLLREKKTYYQELEKFEEKKLKGFSIKTSDSLKEYIDEVVAREKARVYEDVVFELEKVIEGSE
jgi:Lar family restriction alleviation protein